MSTYKRVSKPIYIRFSVKYSSVLRLISKAWHDSLVWVICIIWSLPVLLVPLTFRIIIFSILRVMPWIHILFLLSLPISHAWLLQDFMVSSQVFSLSEKIFSNFLEKYITLNAFLCFILCVSCTHITYFFLFSFSFIFLGQSISI